ncbi:hypothetical protein AHF37_11415 [Paragonimus kellicotti]|nr:hypothetical protein AHF37_11415 [Paragonimus kellicotti]
MISFVKMTFFHLLQVSGIFPLRSTFSGPKHTQHIGGAMCRTHFTTVAY